MLTIRLLPSSFEGDGTASSRQHYACFVVNGCVAFDAGSLANGITELEKNSIRDVVVTHAHLDHIAGLPLFIDDLFPILQEPIRVHASLDVIEVLETHIFNWKVYPRFSEIKNSFGPVIEYRPIPKDLSFDVRGLKVRAVPVNHKVPSYAFLIRFGNESVVMTGDTAEMSGFWDVVNECKQIDALLIECAFPDEFEDLAAISHHLTPRGLRSELKKIKTEVGRIYVTNMKPSYREIIVEQLRSINDERLTIFEVGRQYSFG